MNVKIEPLPAAYVAIPARLRPQHAPIFAGACSREDAELAILLIEALDPESRGWYASSLAQLRAFLADD
jgi:hypothetical protein